MSSPEGPRRVEETDAEYAGRMKELKREQDAKVRQKSTDRGILIVNTGDGKGKSTAAFGTALRAVGHGQRVLVCQFIKGTWKTGERESFRRLEGIDHVECGNGFTWNTQDRDKDIASARDGWNQVVAAIERCRGEIPAYQLIVLDELNVVLHYGFLPTREVLAVLSNKPRELSIIVTGRDAPPELTEIADTVTEMKAVKHAFDSGIKARKGIEF
jgi:cob(I)alamin adenosyltransferase